jgi:hypothetical protein
MLRAIPDAHTYESDSLTSDIIVFHYFQKILFFWYRMDCKTNILTLPFEYNMSWFICLLVVTMYSQNIREVTLEASKRWNASFPLFKLFNFILHMKYQRSFTTADYEYFETMTLENLMRELHNYNNDKFWFSTDIINPMHAKYYIKNMYDFFDISSLMISVYTDEIVTLDPYNNIKKIDNGMKIRTDVLYPDEVDTELSKTPNILIIRLSTSSVHECSEFRNHPFKFNYYLKKTKNITEILLHDDTLEYNGGTYKLDAVLTDNIPQQNHTIAGITCGNTKYIYNGWLFRPEGEHMIPCELMNFDWTNVNAKFGLNSKHCNIDIPPRGKKSYFSFGEGERILIYVKSQIDKPMFVDKLSFKPEYKVSKKFSPTGLLRLSNSLGKRSMHSATRSKSRSKTKSKSRSTSKSKAKIYHKKHSLSPIPE